MVLTEMNKEHFCFGGDFETFLTSMIYKIQINVLKNDLILKGLILGIDTDKLHSFLKFGDPPAKVHKPCHLYLHSYYC